MTLGNPPIAECDKNRRVFKAPNLTPAEFNAHLENGSLCFVFTGITGSGKTTTSRKLTNGSRVTLVDIDEVILNQVLRNGVLRESLHIYANNLAHSAARRLLDSILQRGSLCRQEAEFLESLHHGDLLVAALSALFGQSVIGLAPLTFLSLSAEGQTIYSNLESQLTLQVVLNTPATGKQSFTIVSASGSLSTLSAEALSTARKASIFVHFKTEAEELESSLAQAAQKPMVVEQGKSLRDTLRQREAFYRQVCHVAVSRKVMWQLNNADEFIGLIRDMLFHIHT